MAKKPLAQPTFLPMSSQEMNALGWTELDILFITGDAYVDHPAFGVALLGRMLVENGFRVGICAQPKWQNTDDIMRMGRPRLFAGITAGALDSQLAHYTAFRKKRHDDAYTPGGECGARPNRASIIYANLARKAFPKLPIVLGGIEASLRRISHYDFWSDSLRRSILLDAKADLLVYGMGELALLNIAKHCAKQKELAHIAGTAWMSKNTDNIDSSYLQLPTHVAILEKKSLLLQATLELERQVHTRTYAVQMYENRALIIAPPANILNEKQMDELYALPFQRAAHPNYDKSIPAEVMLRTSITSHRGCGGGCSFCSLALHQGRRISSRSAKSIKAEAHNMSKKKNFSGSISDVGGPTANMWQGYCALEKNSGEVCKRESCCHPKVCKFFITPQKKHVELLRSIRQMDGIKHVRVASGIRADIAMHEPEAINAYTCEFTGGQLKIAPEHCSELVLNHMRKPSVQVFEFFLKAFYAKSNKAGREQYVVPYLMSAFPGCTDAQMQELAKWLEKRSWKPKQVQCFIPTPGTVATAMYYCGLDAKGQSIYVARSDADRLRQHRILIPTMGKMPKKGDKGNAPRTNRDERPIKAAKPTKSTRTNG